MADEDLGHLCCSREVPIPSARPPHFQDANRAGHTRHWIPDLFCEGNIKHFFHSFKGNLEKYWENKRGNFKGIKL